MQNLVKHRPGREAILAVVAVGREGGRGFIIETRDGNRLVLTAAHCLPAVPEAHPWAEESRVWRVLGPLGKEPNVIAECYFVDPIADIAVLGRPDDVELTNAYDEFMEERAALSIGCLPPKESAELDGWLLAPDRRWFHCTAKYRREGPLWLRDPAEAVVGGMSGSPILADHGSAIGIVSSSNSSGSESGPNPSLGSHLPGWLLRSAITKTVRSRASQDGRQGFRQRG